jgi:3D (Asp-Asp-Asp) domain-containing protein
VEVAPGRVRLVSGVFEIPRAALAGRDADESIGPTIHVDTVRFELDVREVRPGPEPTMRTLRCRVTAYCPCARCCDEMTGRTATGTNAWRPGVASDWAALPAGTRVRIEGYGVAEVDDTGAAMRRSWRDRGEVHLDVRMTYHWQARQWGSRWMDVEVLGG